MKAWALLTVPLLGSAVLACSVVWRYQKVTQNVSLRIEQGSEPLKGSQVLIRRSGTDLSNIPVQSVSTGADGNVELRNLDRGRYDIFLLWEDKQTQVAAFEVLPGTEDRTSTVTAKLPRKPDPPPPVPLKAINGLVLDSSGAAIAGAKIRVAQADKLSAPVVNSEANETGQFAISVAPGKYLVRIVVPGFQTAEIPVEIDNASQKAWTGFRVTMPVSECGDFFPSPYKYSIAELQPQ